MNAADAPPLAPPAPSRPSAADAAPERPRLRPRGSSQGGLRQYNERVVLQAVRLHGPLPGAEIARLTQLTAQTVSQITKRLVDDGLLVRGAPRRGKVGQPSVPLSLNPDGAFAVGVKVGRRSLDTLLIDFAGAIRQRWTLAYDHARPDAVLGEIGRRLKDVDRRLGPDGRGRLQGIGIAAPLSLGGWQSLIGLGDDVADAWRRVDLRAQVGRLADTPVTLLKDTAAACVAELITGRGRSLPSFLYVFVDTFIGGGLVLDSHLRPGPTGNAGAIGSMHFDMRGTPPQLLAVASLLGLERRYVRAGVDPAAVSDARAMQPPWRVHTEAWIDDAAAALAAALHAAACLVDPDGVIVDGSIDRTLLDALLAAVARALDRCDWEGVARPALLPGTIGSDARALGGALLPLHVAFSPDPQLFLKAAAAA